MIVYRRPSVTDEAIPLSQPNEIPENVKVLKFDAPLHFVNTNRFIDSFLDEIQNDEVSYSFTHSFRSFTHSPIFS